MLAYSCKWKSFNIMTKLKVLVGLIRGIVTCSHFRLATCSLQKYLEISYYRDNENFLNNDNDFS